MKKFIKILSILMIVSLMLVCVVACNDTDNTGDENTPVHVDYVSSLKLDMTTSTAKQVVTIKQHVDGDTVHFYVPTSIKANGILKGRFLAVNTPESTGKIENYGHTASRFTEAALKDAHSILIESDTSDGKWNLDSTGDRHTIWVWYKKTADSEYRNLNVELLQNGLAVASNTANNRYGQTAMAALTQAKTEKLYVHSGVPDPEVYRGEAVPLTMKELRTNIEEYNGIKVAVEGVITMDSDNTVYVESYDEETGIYYGISVYYGFGFTGIGKDILTMGNKAIIIGTVQYYKAGGTYQLSDIRYRELKPNDPNNIKLVSKGHEGAYPLVDGDTFANGKVTIETETEEAIESKEFDFANLMLSASISMENLTVTSVYTTNNGGDSDGAMTLTCLAEDGATVDVRTNRLYDENDQLLTAEDFEGKTINVKGIVDYFNGDYQIKVFRLSDITIVE